MKYDYEIAIVGAGAAGYAAAIYAGRSGARAAVFDRGVGGGLTTEAPKVENYPGFKSIGGMELMEKMKEHAAEYAEMRFGEEVTSLEVREDAIGITTTKGTYHVGAVILCTGTAHRKLGVKGEQEFAGKGVSYCATCDGFFFKGKKVAVVGGGSSAVIEAIFLRQIGIDVSVIHRRDELRAEKALEEEAKENGVRFIWNSVVEEILGKEMVEKLKIKNVKTGEVSMLEVDGVFVSIGEEPQNSLAKEIGVALDENGYIKVDGMQKTNVERVFAAGDVTGGVRQIITACAQGAKATLSSLPLVGKRSPY
ncbi:MAG: thioredoxin-disulfide reductase [Thermoplasmata archaeon]|nr:MAG: thioredoxin-disulfide reductase [Thermoplasmata archaeon]RLF59848.1 MAG: thioredoxin-disulfide reductase [Thermoplasmata archaeon]